MSEAEQWPQPSGQSASETSTRSSPSGSPGGSLVDESRLRRSKSHKELQHEGGDEGEPPEPPPLSPSAVAADLAVTIPASHGSLSRHWSAHEVLVSPRYSMPPVLFSPRSGSAGPGSAGGRLTPSNSQSSLSRISVLPPREHSSCSSGAASAATTPPPAQPDGDGLQERPTPTADGLSFFLQLSTMFAKNAESAADTGPPAAAVDMHEAKFQSPAALEDRFCRFPADEVQVRRVTNWPGAPASPPQVPNPEELEPRVRLCLETPPAEFVVVRRLYAHRVAQRPHKDAPHEEFEERAGTGRPSSRGSRKSSDGLVESPAPVPRSPTPTPADALHPEWLAAVSPEADARNAIERSQMRTRLLDHYMLGAESGEISVSESAMRTPPDVPSVWTRPMIKVMVEIKYLYMQLGDFEPFSGSVALYDLSAREKISEDFYYDCSPISSRTLATGSTSFERDPATTCLKAVFSLPSERNLSGKNIWAFVKVFKVFQGDPEDAQEPYMHSCEPGTETKESVKAQKQVSDRIKEVYRRWGNHRQYFGCCAFEVVTDDGQVQIGPKQTSLLRTMVEETKDVYETIADLKKRGGKAEQKKVMPSYWTAHVYTADQIPMSACWIDTNFRTCLQSLPASFDSLWPRDDTDMITRGLLSDVGKTDSAKRIEKAPELVREIQEFLQTPEAYVNIGFVNNIYIYPDSLNLSREKRKPNIELTVYLRDSDTALSGTEEDFLPFFFGRSWCKMFSRSSSTCVAYRNRTPSFTDEIKAKLPLPLGPKHHLLFIFRHIPTESDDQEATWYTHLKLYDNSKIIESKEHNLLLYSGSPSANYLTAPKEPMYADSKDAAQRTPFKLRLLVVSSVYHKEESVNKFLNQITSVSPTSVESMRDFFDLRPEVITQKMVPVVTGLIAQLCRPSLSLATDVANMKALFAVLRHVAIATESDGPRSTALCQYITYFLRNCNTKANKANKNEVFEGLASVFKAYLAQVPTKAALCDDVAISAETALCFTWFILEAISKSLTLAIYTDGNLGDPKRHQWLSADERWEEFSSSMKAVANSLGSLVRSSVKHNYCSRFTLEANAAFGFFVRDLFSCFHRGRTIEMVRAYVDGLHHEGDKLSPGKVSVLYYLQFEFLNVVADYEYFLPLDLPLPESVDTIDNLCDTLFQKHPLSGLIIREAFRSLSSPNEDARAQALQCLNKILWKLEHDERYQDAEAKNRIAVLFFPVLLLSIDDYRRVAQWKEISTKDNAEERALFVIILYVLKNLDKDLLSTWWSSEVMSRLTIFLNYTGSILRYFEWNSMPKMTAATFFSNSRKRIEIELQAQCSLIPEEDKAAPPTTPILGDPRIKDFYDRSKGTIGSSLRKFGKVATMARVGSLRTGSRDRLSHFIKPGTLGLPADSYDQQKVERNYKAVSVESSLILLDTLEHLMASLHTELLNKDLVLMNKVFSVIVVFLETNQSVRFYSCLFASLRSFVSKFRALLFSIETPYCGDLCDQLVRLSNYSHDAIRSHATAALYLLSRHNYKESCNIEKMRVHVTMALAKLDLDDTRNFERALVTISAYAQSDSEQVPPLKPLGHVRRLSSVSNSADVALSPIVADESESRKRAVTVDRAIRQMRLEAQARSVEHRTGVLEELCVRRLALIDALKSDGESFAARQWASDDICAALDALKARVEALVAESATTELSKHAASKVTKLQQKWSQLKRSAAHLAAAIKDEQASRAAAAAAAQQYDEAVTGLCKWIVSQVPVFGCTSRCLQRDYAENLKEREKLWSDAEREFEERAGSVRQLEHGLNDLARSYVTLAASEKSLRDVFEALQKLHAAHCTSLVRSSDLVEQKKLRKTRNAEAKKAAKDFIKTSLLRLTAETGAMSLSEFMSQGEKLINTAAGEQKSLNHLPNSAERAWQHVRPIVAAAGDLQALVKTIDDKTKERKAMLQAKADTEKQEVMFAKDVEAVVQWIERVKEHCTGPISVATEDAAKALMEQHKQLADESRAQGERRHSVQERVHSLQLLLGRRLFSGVSVGDIGKMWEASISLLQERKLLIQSEASRQRANEDSRHAFADKVAGITKMLDRLRVEPAETQGKLETEIASEIQQALALRWSLLEASIADFGRYTNGTIEDLEDRMRRVKVSSTSSASESDAAGASAPSTPMSPRTNFRSPSAILSRYGDGLTRMRSPSLGNLSPQPPSPVASAMSPPSPPEPRRDTATSFFSKFRGSLKENILSLDAVPKRLPFSQSIQELCAHLIKIIRDTQKLSRMKRTDAEADEIHQLYLDIAQSYSNTPDLHVAWLLKLADTHEREKNFVEAGMCKVYAVKVIYDNIRAKLPIALDVSILTGMFPMLAATEADARSEVRCVSAVVSEEGLVGTVGQAIDLLKRSEHYEFCTDMFNFVAPLMTARHDHALLADLHLRMHQLFTVIAQKDSGRLLGTFFRLGYYGQAFEGLDGAEFVLKEPAGTHLFELTERLKQRFSKRFNEDVVLLDSTQSASSADKTKRSLQVTAIKPYFDEDELAKRDTYFMKNTVVSRFFYDTPFTKEGGVHAEDPRKQWKRKIILYAGGTFPGILRRLRVQTREVVELSPIENAIEVLQLILQGSVLARVNGGITEVCHAFLSAEGRKDQDALCAQRLLEAIQELLGTCRRALDANREFIKQDQLAFHMDLESGYEDLEKRIKSFAL
eukprot:m51a1_g7003 hypothetical protein (2666) ;mRNA; r:212191-222239